MSPAGKPRQCTHVRLSTTLSSPSRPAQYSTLVSVIAYTSRSLRTRPGILDLEENRTPNLIFNWTERWDKEGEGGEGWAGDTDLVGGVSEKKLSWALITHRGNEGFVVLFFVVRTFFYEPHVLQSAYTELFTSRHARGDGFDMTSQCNEKKVYWLLWSCSIKFEHSCSCTCASAFQRSCQEKRLLQQQHLIW